MSEHTKLPWRKEFIGRSGGGTGIDIYDVVTDTQMVAERLSEDDAEFIVTACNAHATLIQQRDELSTCLNDVLNMLKAAHMQIGMRSEENPRVIRARAALAKVKP